MENKRPYQKPALQAYGDVRTITAHFKEFGFADGFILVQDDNTDSLKDLSG